MNEQRAQELLGDAISTDGLLDGSRVEWHGGSITLSGHFSVKELEAVLWWVRWRGESPSPAQHENSIEGGPPVVRPMVRVYAEKELPLPGAPFKPQPLRLRMTIDLGDGEREVPHYSHEVHKHLETGPPPREVGERTVEIRGPWGFEFHVEGESD